MKKKGFWNFFGLASRNNIQELEDKVDEVQTVIVNRLGIIAKHLAKQVEIQKNSYDDIKHIEEEIYTNVSTLMRDINNCRKEISEVRSSLDDFSKQLESGNVQINDKIDEASANVEKQIQFTNESIKNCDYFLRDMDWKVEQDLTAAIQEINRIVNRIDNMDPIVNMEKIENLLKMIVVNELMDGME